MVQVIPKFHVRCDAGPFGAFDVETERVSVKVAQAISRDGAEQIWDFVLVLARREGDGTLSTRVFLCHPDWDEAQEIASIQSSPAGINLQIGETKEFASSRL